MLDLEEEAQRLKGAYDYSGALQARLKLEQLHRQFNEPPVQQSKNLNFIAFLGVHTRNLDEAERAARLCLELYRAVAEKKDEKLATYIMMLAAVLAENRKFEEAVIFGEEAVALFARNHGDNDSFVQYRKRDVERMRNKDTRPYLSGSLRKK